MANEVNSGNVFLTVLEASFMILLNVSSLLGYVLVCISVYRNKRLCTSTNLYIAALAISDLLSTIFVIPLAVGVLISGRWPFGGTVCEIHAFIAQFVVYISPVTMGLTTINRYVRICKSDQQYKRFFSAQKISHFNRFRVDVCCLLYFDCASHWLTGISLRARLCSVHERTCTKIWQNCPLLSRRWLVFYCSH